MLPLIDLKMKNNNNQKTDQSIDTIIKHVH